MVELDFGGVIENVVTRKEFTVEQAQRVLKGEVVATLGYGIQGRAQSLNMRDNGIKVVVGQKKGIRYDLAVKKTAGSRRNTVFYGRGRAVRNHQNVSTHRCRTERNVVHSS